MNTKSSGLAGIENLLRLDRLPYLKKGIRTRYEGSIDKKGANADCDWWLYLDKNQEWVLFDVDGPGCLYNFVQHRMPTSTEPIFRFYFDNEEQPRFTIRHSEFGEVYPFVEPLASRYIGPAEHGIGPIRVCRSFVPMPFQKHCRITSSVRLEGCDGGGWGHVIYHAYQTADGIKTFSLKDDYDPLIEQWKNLGQDPKKLPDRWASQHSGLIIEPGSDRQVYEHQGRGFLTTVQMRCQPDVCIDDLWIRMTWDRHELPDLFVPLKSFFTNELGLHRTGYLMTGYLPDGICYNYYPMPFWSHAVIELVNCGDVTRTVPWIGIRTGLDPDMYPEGDCAYFRAAPYYNRKATPGSDSILADLRGQGHVVASVITAYGSREHEATCEGDVRVYIDGLATPQIESDGSESYSCYGWGFPTPPETNPASGYDGLKNSPWSMCRHCLGDWYPFDQSLRFGIESGGNNDQYLEHSGVIYYYGLDQAGAIRTDEIDLGSTVSEQAHQLEMVGSYQRFTLSSQYEGDDDHLTITDDGIEQVGASSFWISIDPQNCGIRIRRRSDQKIGQQKANIYIDGTLVLERSWYYADRNPFKRWLDDEFEVPEHYTTGKSKIRLTIVAMPADGKSIWNACHYWIDSLVR